MAVNLKELGQRVRAARVAQGWTVDELARRSGLNRCTVMALEAGRNEPEWLTVRTILQALGLSLGELEAACRPR